MNILQICPRYLLDVATLPSRLEIQNVIFHQYYTYFWLLTLSQKKTKCDPLAHPTWNVTTLTCDMQNLLIWLRAGCVPLNVGVSETSRLWVEIGGSKKNWLWCVSTGMSGKQRHSKCSRWPSTFCTDTCFQSISPLINRIVHHADTVAVNGVM